MSRNPFIPYTEPDLYRKFDKQKYFKDYYQANKERILNGGKEYSEANKDKINACRRKRWEANKDKLNAEQRKRRDAHREEFNAKCKNKYDAKKAAGYRYRKDPETGKHRWVFVGKEDV